MWRFADKMSARTAVCPVPFNSARAFVALGSWLVEVTKCVCIQGLLWMDLLLTAVGVENRERISSGALFYKGRHVTPRGCWYSVKQNFYNLEVLKRLKDCSEEKNQILARQCSYTLCNRSSWNSKMSSNDKDLLTLHYRKIFQKMIDLV